MRTIIILFSFLAILGLAVIGCLFIFEVRNAEQSLDLLLKVEGAILLLAGCSALISTLLAGANKNQ
jgi:ABC-type Fe3+-siderophore transport system permease subunit